MDYYIYETHLHTCEGSACGRVPGNEYIKEYLDKGYAGIFVTDHFFNGNSAVPRNLPWEERIDLYCVGFEKAAEEGYKQGLQVFFGLEVNFHGDEYLLYGPTKEWLKAHPEIMQWTHMRLREEVHKIGGVMVQAHPFRDRDYLNAIYVHPYQCDAFEGYNLGNPVYSDCYGYDFAKNNHILMTSGSDIHSLRTMKEELGGMCFNRKIESSLDYAARVLKAKESVPIVLDDERAKREAIAKLSDDNYGFVIYKERMVPDPANTVFDKEIFVADKNNVDISYTKDNVLEVRI